jgi:Spy/CpxP family protein refolding chaperone
MKKIVITALVVMAIATVQAQDIPQRKDEGYRPHAREHMGAKREMANLNLTEEQKAKFKEISKQQQEQVAALRKLDNITVKEQRERMEKIREDHKQKVNALLTPDQKATMEKSKSDRQAKMKDYGKKRDERMKTELNLTADQSAKISENRKASAEKMRAIREDKSLSLDQKKEKMKEVMKAQKENMKKVLTEEQLAKMKAQHKDHKRRGGGERKGDHKKNRETI